MQSRDPLKSKKNSYFAAKSYNRVRMKEESHVSSKMVQAGGKAKCGVFWDLGVQNH